MFKNGIFLTMLNYKKNVARICIVSAVLLFCSLLHAAESTQYRGFTVNYLNGRLDDMESVIHKQIDKLLAIGLPKDMVQFMQTIPIQVSNVTESSPGHFSNHKVQIDARILAIAEKPVLIHEYMHALHFMQLPGGVRNPEIFAYYNEAQQKGAYNLSSHMMSNVAEYFATTSTSYLYGITAQEPFSRAKVKNHQLNYYNYLARLFGPGAGQYLGNLE